MLYRHIMLVEIETKDPDLNVSELQETVLTKLDSIPDVHIAVVEDRQIVKIHKMNI